MAIEIVSTTAGSETNKKLSLSSASYARTMSIGGDWTMLRIAARLTYITTRSGGSDLIFSRMYFGLCSGTTDVPLSGNIKHFLGYEGPQTIRITDATLVQIGHVSNSFSTRFTQTKIVNNTPVIATQNTDGDINFSREARLPSVLFITIKKGTPYQVWVSMSQQATRLDYQKMMGSASNVPQYTTQMTSGSNVNMAVDEATDGTLDTIFFGWADLEDKWEIADIGYNKMA